MKPLKRLIALSCISVMLCLWSAASLLRTHGQEPAAQLRDPKAWGSNHVGKPVPEYVHGDECLFCHRNTVGATWQKNAHGTTMRQLEDAGKLRDLLKQPELAAVAKDIEYFLGSRQHIRFLKKEGFGKFALLNTRVVLDDTGKVVNWIEQDKPTWDKEKFANNCAGCHATGIDTKAKTFAAFGLDCYVCHGDVNLEHANDTKLMILSKKRHDESELITSLCAQCHLREGKSNSSGLPYPNNFIAGDNLFQDFAVDFAKTDDEKLNPIDRHIYRNARDVAVNGKASPTCVTCHQVHFDARPQSFAKHIIAPRGPICFDCHASEAAMNTLKPYTKSSKVCEY